jgi:hypothetical protein
MASRAACLSLEVPNAFKALVLEGNSGPGKGDGQGSDRFKVLKTLSVNQEESSMGWGKMSLSDLVTSIMLKMDETQSQPTKDEDGSYSYSVSCVVVGFAVGAGADNDDDNDEEEEREGDESGAALEVMRRSTRETKSRVEFVETTSFDDQYTVHVTGLFLPLKIGRDLKHKFCSTTGAARSLMTALYPDKDKAIEMCKAGSPAVNVVLSRFASKQVLFVCDYEALDAYDICPRFLYTLGLKPWTTHGDQHPAVALFVKRLKEQQQFLGKSLPDFSRPLLNHLLPGFVNTSRSLPRVAESVAAESSKKGSKKRKISPTGSTGIFNAIITKIHHSSHHSNHQKRASTGIVGTFLRALGEEAFSERFGFLATSMHANTLIYMCTDKESCNTLVDACVGDMILHKESILEQIHSELNVLETLTAAAQSVHAVHNG